MAACWQAILDLDSSWAEMSEKAAKEAAEANLKHAQVATTQLEAQAIAAPIPLSYPHHRSLFPSTAIVFFFRGGSGGVCGTGGLAFCRSLAFVVSGEEPQ